jgi:RNA polymerase sigma factor (sigma-70 family)
MATVQLGAVLRQLHRLADERPGNQPADEELLRAFLGRRDQAAFGLILRRHGPMVLRVCRRVLANLQDAEDVFQATFLFLAQQAGAIKKPASLASWLHGVARRMATNARRSAARRARHERHSRPAPDSDPARQAAWHELQAILDEEIEHLPETYREPLVRCCLEHHCCAEVAAQMGLQETTVRRRVSRARKILEGRLGRRGVPLTLAAAAVAIEDGRTAAAVAPALLRETAAAVTRLVAAGGLTTGVASAGVAALLEGAKQALVVAKLKTALVALVGTLLLTGGAALVCGLGLPEAGPDAARPAEGPASAAPARPGGGRTDVYGDPLPDEAMARLGTTRFRPGEHVYALRFTPDGARLITQSQSGLRVWDAASGRELWRFGAAGKALTTGDISADGKLALTADAEAHGALRLWDVDAGRQLRTCGNAGLFGPVRLAPDGKTVAAPGPVGEIELRDAATGERRHTLKGQQAKNSSAAFAADSKTLATGGYDKTIRLWDVATGRELRRIDCPEAVGSVVLSADGKLLASVGVHEENPAPGIIGWMPDSQIRIWDTATGKELRRLVVPAKATDRAGVVAVAFARDSKTVVTLGIDYVLRVWDVTTGKALQSFPGCSTNHGALALTPDGKAAAIVNGGTALRVIDLATGNDRVPLTGHGGGVYAAAVTPEGRTVFTAGGDDAVGVWDAATGKELRRLRGHGRWVAGLRLSPDGRLLYSLGSDGRVRTWETTAGRERPRPAGEYAASSLGMLALSADGKLLAAAPEKKSLALLDAATGKLLRTFAGLDGRVCYGAGFAPDGRTLVAWTADQEVCVLDVRTGATRIQYPFASDEDKRLSYVAAMSPDGRRLAFGSQHRFLSVMDAATGEQVRRFDKLPDGVSVVAFSPNGRTLAWGGWNDPTIHLLELSTGGERHRFHGHQGRILALHFAPDGGVLVSGGNDATALMWDLRGRKAAGEKAPSAEELAALWKELGTADAARGYDFVRRLARWPAAVQFLGTQVRPVPAADARQVAPLLADLDSGDFKVRDRASRELERIGEQAAGAVRQALADAPTLEARRRLERLLGRQAAEERQPSAERVRLMRALEALELADTRRAREILAGLAGGASGAWLTEQARGARECQSRRPPND